MIIFGTGTKTLGTKKLQLENCPNCGSNNVHITCVAKYFDLFWIPTFPIERNAFPECHSCHQQLTITDQKTIDKIRKEKKKFKYPFYLYSGIGAVILLISLVFYFDHIRTEEVGENLADLKTSNVIVFEGENNTYSYAKVISISSDTLFVNLSNYVFEGGTPDEDTYLIDEEKHDDFYDTEIYYYSQSTLDSLHKEGAIYDLYRLEE